MGRLRVPARILEHVTRVLKASALSEIAMPKIKSAAMGRTAIQKTATAITQKVSINIALISLNTAGVGEGGKLDRCQRISVC
jgi:hypothetical protein